MSASEVKQYFDDAYDQYKIEKTAQDEKIEILDEWFNFPIQVLDIGCGSTAFLQFLNSNFDVRGYGIDTSRSMLPECINDSPLEVIQADANHLPFDNKFDFIHFDTVLHHLVGETREESYRTVRSALVGASKLLHPDGLLCVTERFHHARFIPDRWLNSLIFYVLQEAPTLVRPFDSDAQSGLLVSFYTEKQMKTLLSEAGLEMVTTQRNRQKMNTAKKPIVASHGRINYWACK